ncbi:MBL fold metallo-hydrolase [Candidatus Latescibacterota bacterium]
MRTFFITLMLIVFVFNSASAQTGFKSDTIATSGGPLTIMFLGHGSLMFTFNDHVMHLDPWGRVADYSKLPKADLALLTHQHADHLDPSALKQILTDDSTLIYTKTCSEKFPGGKIISNGEKTTFEGIHIEAVPAYTGPVAEIGEPHPIGECNGYILTFGGKRIYIASETVYFPEMKQIDDIDVMFLAMDGVYNISPTEAVKIITIIKPKVIYPYHFANADLTPFIEAFKGNADIEVRIRDMK